MTKVSSLIISSFLLLFAFAGNTLVQSSEQILVSSTQLQTINYQQDTSIETDGPSDEKQTQAALSPRLAATEFQHQKQLSPNYELAIEFNAEDLSAKHFVYIRTIPDIQPWFELTAFVPNKSRVSGWKDSRPLHPLNYTDLIQS